MEYFEELQHTQRNVTGLTVIIKLMKHAHGSSCTFGTPLTSTSE